MKRTAVEVNFDGIVGPTHNYGGLSYGNIASIRHGSTVSNPRAALFQGLEKMKLLADLGVPQAVLPPHERPDIESLRRLGFRGNDSRIIAEVHKKAPFLLARCYSSSAMWAANAATVSPSADTADTRVHFTPANLITQFHRCIEPAFTGILLKTIFSDNTAFAHHEPVPACIPFSDEGAANHTRLCNSYGHAGIELFAYGRRASDQSEQGPSTYPARHSLEASQAIARLHQLDPQTKVFARQNPDAIDAGVFHNDVISVGNENVFFYHSLAFDRCPSLMDELSRKFSRLCRDELVLIEVGAQEVPIEDAVESYLFNSQLVTLPDNTMCLIAPVECRENPRTSAVLERVLSQENPIQKVLYVDVRQSMKNGGGPACLRLRVVLTPEERSLTHDGVFFTDRLYEELRAWGARYYRDHLDVDELSDPSLPDESRAALDALTRILKIGSLYRFQTAGA
ncbi:MAG: N-succinylarginine dihydrolase [Deltaproteobacteria bacterium]